VAQTDPTRDGAPPEETPSPPRSELVDELEPPVVARLVLEIRSDGLRTIARGAMEDVRTGQRALVDAAGTTPLALAAALARSMFAAPGVAHRAGQAVRALLTRGRRGE
jgi:hypothetical protein